MIQIRKPGDRIFILDVLESRNEYDVEVGGDIILENRNDSHADPKVVFSD